MKTFWAVTIGLFVLYFLGGGSIIYLPMLILLIVIVYATLLKAYDFVSRLFGSMPVYDEPVELKEKSWEK